MKKIITFIGSLALMCVLFLMPAEAARYTNQAASMAMMTKSGEVVFTINDVEVYPDLPEYVDGKYVKEIDIWITEKNIVSNPEFLVYCYDHVGNNIDSEYITMEYDDGYSQYHAYLYVEPNTASIEILPSEPGGWYNSYYYCRYERMTSVDGRQISVHDLLVPEYEVVGWHEDVWVYALDGRELLIAYFELPAYKAVGWYELEDIVMIEFREELNENLRNRKYDDILDDVDWLFGFVEKEIYRQELYNIQAQTMDKWRTSINAPMALVDFNVYYDEDEGCDILALSFRNVSYKTIVAYKTSLTCRDIFGDIIDDDTIYYSDSANIAPGQIDTYYYRLDNYDTDYISNFKVEQVVFEDRTSWYGR